MYGKWDTGNGRPPSYHKANDSIVLEATIQLIVKPFMLWPGNQSSVLELLSINLDFESWRNTDIILIKVGSNRKSD